MRWMFLLVAMVGCAAKDDKELQNNEPEHFHKVAFRDESSGPTVWEYRDEAHHATCYVAIIFSGTGIACLRDEVK